MQQSGYDLQDWNSANDLLLGFLDVIKAQPSGDAGMHIGLMKRGIVKYIKRRRDKTEAGLNVAQVIVSED